MKRERKEEAGIKKKKMKKKKNEKKNKGGRRKRKEEEKGRKKKKKKKERSVIERVTDLDDLLDVLLAMEGHEEERQLLEEVGVLFEGAQVLAQVQSSRNNNIATSTSSSNINSQHCITPSKHKRHNTRIKTYIMKDNTQQTT